MKRGTVLQELPAPLVPNIHSPGSRRFYTAEQMLAYALHSRSDLLDELERLRRDCAEAYQVIGAAMLGVPCAYKQDDVARALDNLSAAADGRPRAHEDLLPWPLA